MLEHGLQHMWLLRPCGVDQAPKWWLWKPNDVAFQTRTVLAHRLQSPVLSRGVRGACVHACVCVCVRARVYIYTCAMGYDACLHLGLGTLLWYINMMTLGMLLFCLDFRESLDYALNAIQTADLITFDTELTGKSRLTILYCLLCVF